MRLSTWNEAGLGRIKQDIADAFLPMVRREAPAGDPEWSSHVWKRRRRLVRWLVKRQLGKLPPQPRHAAAIRDEYASVWGRGYGRYCLTPEVNPKPWQWDRHRYWADSIAATRFRQVILARLIEHLKPRRVLEVGCGNGINLILLACRFPEIEFSGLELTPAGHAAASRFQAENATLPEHLLAYAPLPLADPTAFRRIRFIEGTAETLPFADGAFDLTMTVLALEQMEMIRPRALSEVVRVTGSHALLLEPFKELNGWGWRLLNRIKRHYFAGRVSELADYGLEPQYVFGDYPQEVFLRTCVALCRKRPG